MELEQRLLVGRSAGGLYGRFDDHPERPWTELEHPTLVPKPTALELATFKVR